MKCVDYNGPYNELRNATKYSSRARIHFLLEGTPNASQNGVLSG